MVPLSGHWPVMTNFNGSEISDWLKPATANPMSHDSPFTIHYQPSVLLFRFHQTESLFQLLQGKWLGQQQIDLGGHDS